MFLVITQAEGLYGIFVSLPFPVKSISQYSEYNDAEDYIFINLWYYRTKTIFYLNLKHIHKYGSAKFQPNPLFSSLQMATKSVGEEKKNCEPIDDPVEGWDAPINLYYSNDT